MSTEREEFAEIVAGLRAEAAEMRYADLNTAVEEHVQMIAAGLGDGTPFACYQVAEARFNNALAEQHDWAALAALARTNAELLATALVQLAQVWRNLTTD